MRTRMFSTATALAVMALLVIAAPVGAALTPPVVPASIAVPPGNVLYLVGHAKGYQVYRCQGTNGSTGWVLAYPFATLYNDANQAVATHYAGPSWTAADTSTVVATRIGSAAAPGGNAIPWLLLQATSTSGPPGGTFTNTTFIQRINTTGGLAPATGCDAGHIGALTAVFYTADYYFYRAA
ncbi:MAG: DUF3455 domain-containing protein [Acidimicrobiales bacterium]